MKISSFVYLLKKKKKEAKLKTIFSEKGEEKIREAQEILLESGYKFFFDMGTLLGIYRDSKLLTRDMDIDIAVYIKDERDIVNFQKYLSAQGWTHGLSFNSSELCTFQDTFYSGDIRIDICYYKTEKENDICYLLYESNVVELRCTHISDTTKIDFAGTKINIPADTEKYLEERYGNWRIPDKHYKYWAGPSAKITSYQGECIKIE